MTDRRKGTNPAQQVEAASKAFEQEFERFVRFTGGSTRVCAGSIWSRQMPKQRELAELRTRHLGKKSALAAVQEAIGRVPARRARSFWSTGSDNRSRDRCQRRTRRSRPQKSHRSRSELRAKHRRHAARPASALADIFIRSHFLRESIEDIFVSLGYAIEDGREIETDFYNFDALNIPDNHPARAPQDTFYTTDGFALRSQTSTVQIHAMQRRGAPVRMIAPGRVFRRDTPDPTHNPMFFQVEGLCVDRGISMAHLKGTVAEFLRRMFGAQTVTRFRPSYFPFTEPSAEFDFSCFKCGGAGCRICKNSGWIELGGSGMVHPNVLRGAGVDPEEFSGFCVWPGNRSHGRADVRPRRYSAAFRERRSVFRAV